MDFIDELRNDRMGGVTASGLLKKSEAFVSTSEPGRAISSFEIFRKAFGPPISRLMPAWIINKNLSPEFIDRQLERRFSRVRLGGFITPRRVADFFSITDSDLSAVLFGLDTKDRIAELTYSTPGDVTVMIKDVEFDASLLWDIQKSIDSSGVSPWWWWKMGAYSRELAFADNAETGC